MREARMGGSQAGQLPSGTWINEPDKLGSIAYSQELSRTIKGGVSDQAKSRVCGNYPVKTPGADFPNPAVLPARDEPFPVRTESSQVVFSRAQFPHDFPGVCVADFNAATAA